jgi:hypothetical protein
LDEARLAKRQTESEIVSSESALFFESVAELLRENLESFNSEMGLVEDHAFTFTHVGSEFSFGRRLTPLFFRKAMFRQDSKSVIVRTTIFRGYGRKDETVMTWRFSVAHGDLGLNGKNVIECANAMMDGIETLFR